MSLVLERIHGALDVLGLSTAETLLEGHLEQAARQERTYADVLCDLLEAEVDARRGRALATRLRMAGLPYSKTVSQFDFSFQPSIDEKQIRELQTLAGLSEQVEIPFITPGATLQDVRKLGSYLFSTTSSFSAQAERIAEYSVTRLEYKRFAVIYPETIYGKEMARLFSQAVSRQGGEIVAIEAFKDNETDYGRAIRRIKEEDLKQYGTVTTEDLPKGGTVLVYQPGFDAVFIPAAANQIPLIAAQLTFHDVKVPMLGTSTWHSTDLIRLGSRNVEGGIFVDGFVPESPDPTVRGFVETYQHRYQASPSNFAAQAYDATRLILEALRQGAGTGPAVREQLMKLTNLPSLAGPSAFGPGGTLERRVSVLQVRHGQFVQLD